MNPFLDVARPLALAAAKRLMELRQSTLVRERKADHSLVTNADRDADQIIRQGLHKAFPEHAVLTEESGRQGPSNAQYVWVVDPLDGTRAYAKGTVGFSVMIGLLKDSEPIAGVVADPLEGHLYEAALGEGCWYSTLTPALSLRRERVHVSNRRELNEMPIVTSTGFPETLHGLIAEQLHGPWVPAVNSVGIKVGLVVRQVADIYINHHSVHYWDTCAPQIILEEAGGRFSFLDGSAITYDLESDYRHHGPTLATNNQRHADLTKILQPLMRPAES